MARPKFDFDVTTVDFDKRIDIYTVVQREIATKTLHTNGLDLEKEAKLLCPLKTGDLMGSGHTSKVRWRGNEAEVMVYFNKPYAMKVHEEMEPAMGVKQIRPGEDTRNKPATEFGKAGGKYLERPLVGKALRYSKRIADAMKKIK